MRFSIHTKLNKAELKRIDLLLVICDSTSQKLSLAGTFSLLEDVDKTYIQNYVEGKKPKAGESRLLSLNKGPNVFLAFDDFTQAQASGQTEKKIAMLVRKLVRTAKAEGMKQIGIYVDDFTSVAPERVAHLVVENALLAHYDFAETFKSPPAGGWKSVGGISIFTSHDSKKIQTEIVHAELIAEAVNECRTLANMPPSNLNPEGMAESARTVAKVVGKSLAVTVFDEKRLKSEGMNAILAVGQGSSSAPRLIIMEYNGGGAKESPIALVGKGVTFDSGGLNLKPGEHMADMHMDMSGGAAVIYAMYAIAKLKLPINVVGLVPAVENMPSGFSYRQGDIVKAYGGKTMEIGNTDAEGRVILADALEYAKTKKPGLIVSIATLTGSVMSALGTRMSGLFVKDNKPLRDALENIGNTSGDIVWPLPLTEDNEKDVEGNFADVINTSKTNSRYGGASTAAAFLSHFAKGANFAHLDMASRMTSNPDEELSRGALGWGVRYFVELAMQWSEVKKLLGK
jgi:leucyl aminopeptidase